MLKTVLLACRAGIDIIADYLIYQLTPLNHYSDIHAYYTMLPSLFQLIRTNETKPCSII